MEDYSPSAHAIYNSITWGYFDLITLYPRLVEKIYDGILDRSPRLKGFIDKLEDYNSRRKGCIDLDSSSDSFCAKTAQNQAKSWAEKVGASAEAQQAYAEEIFFKMTFWRDYNNKACDHFNKLWKSNWKGKETQVHSHLQQFERSLSSEVRAEYAKKAWATARQSVKGTHWGFREEKRRAYAYYNDLLAVNQYMVRRKMMNPKAEKADILYHGFTHPNREWADGRAKIWAKDVGADAETQKAYADILFEQSVDSSNLKSYENIVKLKKAWDEEKYGKKRRGKSLQADKVSILNNPEVQSAQSGVAMAAKASLERITNAINGVIGKSNAGIINKGNPTHFR